MREITATYRLQFRNGMTFDRAATLLPYLKRLGISHLYASPIFAAASGSTHGYDVTDHTVIDPAIGGREGFERLCAALAEAGLGLILDIVPNHMAASLENPWWQNVVEWGEASLYARHFDIDWREPLTLPVLDKPFSLAVAAGEIALATDEVAGTLGLRCYGHFFPLWPQTYTAALAHIDHPFAARIAAMAKDTTPDNTDAFHAAVKALLDNKVIDFNRKLETISRRPALLESIHAAQPWRLMCWREARRHLSYRRFFEVTGLVGVRVEDERVFDDVHRLILDLVRAGNVQGVRVDHVDGLADPQSYLERLREAVGPEISIHVEKIVEQGEAIPRWPIQGTTGYEFIGALIDLLSCPDGKAILDHAFGDLAGGSFDIEAERRAAKRAMAEKNFETELKGLVRLACATTDASVQPIDETSLREAIVAIILCFPVYRTYGNAAGLSEKDRAIIEKASAKARQDTDAVRQAAVDCIARLLLDPSNGKMEAFRTRFQQLTGPIMAKAVEDTLFYRANSLIGLNEVGGDPTHAGASIEGFHAAMADRLAHQPLGLTGTSTHDTKRGEDARARLYTLSEAPDVWIAAVARWRAMQQKMITALSDGLAPEPETEWLLYQALAGLIDDDIDIANAVALASLSKRFLAYVEKALREAKRRTGWADVNDAYEKAVADYARRLLSIDNRAFLADFTETLKPFARAGEINSLAQTVLKLTVPGIPDIYQGTEGGDFSLVDPDNRREPDFDKLEALLQAGRASPSSTSLAPQKLGLIAPCLHLRRKNPALFASGAYKPLAVSGPKADHILAFSRHGHGMAVIVAIPRLAFDAIHSGSFDPRWFTGTALNLDKRDAALFWRDAITGRELASSATWPVEELFAEAPMAVAYAPF